MKNQAFFSSKDKSEKLKCRLLQFLFGALKVKFSLFEPFLWQKSFTRTYKICIFMSHNRIQGPRLLNFFHAQLN